LHAEAQHELGDNAGALPLMDQAVAINERLVKLEPDSPEATRKLAISLWYRATVLDALGRFHEGVASADRSVVLTRGMRARDPADKGALNLFAVTGEERAISLSSARRFAESYAMADEVVAAHRELVARSNDAPGPRRAMAETMRGLGGVFYKGGQ